MDHDFVKIFNELKKLQLECGISKIPQKNEYTDNILHISEPLFINEYTKLTLKSLIDAKFSNKTQNNHDSSSNQSQLWDTIESIISACDIYVKDMRSSLAYCREDIQRWLSDSIDHSVSLPPTSPLSSHNMNQVLSQLLSPCYHTHTFTVGPVSMCIDCGIKHVSQLNSYYSQLIDTVYNDEFMLVDVLHDIARVAEVSLTQTKSDKGVVLESSRMEKYLMFNGHDSTSHDPSNILSVEVMCDFAGSMMGIVVNNTRCLHILHHVSHQIQLQLNMQLSSSLHLYSSANESVLQYSHQLTLRTSELASAKTKFEELQITHTHTLQNLQEELSKSVADREGLDRDRIRLQKEVDRLVRELKTQEVQYEATVTHQQQDLERYLCELTELRQKAEFVNGMSGKRWEEMEVELSELRQSALAHLEVETRYIELEQEMEKEVERNTAQNREIEALRGEVEQLTRTNTVLEDSLNTKASSDKSVQSSYTLLEAKYDTLLEKSSRYREVVSQLETDLASLQTELDHSHSEHTSVLEREKQAGVAAVKEANRLREAEVTALRLELSNTKVAFEKEVARLKMQSEARMASSASELERVEKKRWEETEAARKAMEVTLSEREGELSRLTRELVTERERRVSEREELVVGYEEKLEVQRVAWEKKVSSVSEAAAVKYEKMRAELEERLEQAGGQMENKESEVSHKYEDKLSKLRSSYESKLAALSSSHEDQLKTVEREWEEKVESLTVRHEATVSSMVEEHRGELTEVHRGFTERLDALKDDSERRVSLSESRRVQEVESLKAIHCEEMAQLREKHDSDIQSLISETDAKLAKKKAQYERVSLQLSSDTDSRLREMDDACSHEIEALKKSFEREMHLLLLKHDSEREEAVSREEALIEKVRSLDNQVAHLSSTVHKLEEDSSVLQHDVEARDEELETVRTRLDAVTKDYQLLLMKHEVAYVGFGGDKGSGDVDDLHTLANRSKLEVESLKHHLEARATEVKELTKQVSTLRLELREKTAQLDQTLKSEQYLKQQNAEKTMALTESEATVDSLNDKLHRLSLSFSSAEKSLKGKDNELIVALSGKSRESALEIDRLTVECERRLTKLTVEHERELFLREKKAQRDVEEVTQQVAELKTQLTTQEAKYKQEHQQLVKSRQRGDEAHLAEKKRLEEKIEKLVKHDRKVVDEYNRLCEEFDDYTIKHVQLEEVLRKHEKEYHNLVVEYDSLMDKYNLYDSDFQNQLHLATIQREAELNEAFNERVEVEVARLTEEYKALEEKRQLTHLSELEELGRLFKLDVSRIEKERDVAVKAVVKECEGEIEKMRVEKRSSEGEYELQLQRLEQYHHQQQLLLQDKHAEEVKTLNATLNSVNTANSTLKQDVAHLQETLSGYDAKMKKKIADIHDYSDSRLAQVEKQYKQDKEHMAQQHKQDLVVEQREGEDRVRVVRMEMEEKIQKQLQQHQLLLQQTQQTHLETLSRDETRHKQRMAELETDWTAKLHHQQQLHAEKVTLLQTDSENRMAQLKDTIKTLEETHKATLQLEMEKHVAEWTQKMTKLQQQHQRVLQDREDDHMESLESVRKQNVKEMAKLRLQYEEEVDDWRAKLNKAVKDACAEVGRGGERGDMQLLLVNSVEKEMQSMKGVLNERLEYLDKQQQQQQQKYESEMYHQELNTSLNLQQQQQQQQQQQYQQQLHALEVLEMQLKQELLQREKDYEHQLQLLQQQLLLVEAEAISVSERHRDEQTQQRQRHDAELLQLSTLHKQQLQHEQHSHAMSLRDIEYKHQLSSSDLTRQLEHQTLVLNQQYAHCQHLEEQHELEVELLKKQHQQELEHLHQDHKLELQQHSLLNAQLEQSHLDRLHQLETDYHTKESFLKTSLEAEYHLELQKVVQTHQKEVADRELRYNTAMEELRAAHRSQLESRAEHSYNVELNELKTVYESDLSSQLTACEAKFDLEKKLMIDEHNVQIQALEKQHLARVREVEERCARDIETEVAAVRSILHIEYTQLLNDLKSENEVQMSQVNTIHSEEVSLLRKRLDSETERLCAEYKLQLTQEHTHYEEQLSLQQRELDELREQIVLDSARYNSALDTHDIVSRLQLSEELEERMSRLRQDHSETVSSLNSRHEHELREVRVSYESRLQRLHEQHQRLASDRSAALSENEHLRTRLNSVETLVHEGRRVAVDVESGVRAVVTHTEDLYSFTSLLTRSRNQRERDISSSREQTLLDDNYSHFLRVKKELVDNSHLLSLSLTLSNSGVWSGTTALVSYSPPDVLNTDVDKSSHNDVDKSSRVSTNSTKKSSSSHVSMTKNSSKSQSHVQFHSTSLPHTTVTGPHLSKVTGIDVSRVELEEDESVPHSSPFYIPSFPTSQSLSPTPSSSPSPLTSTPPSSPHSHFFTQFDLASAHTLESSSLPHHGLKQYYDQSVNDYNDRQQYTSSKNRLVSDDIPSNRRRESSSTFTPSTKTQSTHLYSSHTNSTHTPFIKPSTLTDTHTPSIKPSSNRSNLTLTHTPSIKPSSDHSTHTRGSTSLESPSETQYSRTSLSYPIRANTNTSSHTLSRSNDVEEKQSSDVEEKQYTISDRNRLNTNTGRPNTNTPTHYQSRLPSHVKTSDTYIGTSSRTQAHPNISASTFGTQTIEPSSHTPNLPTPIPTSLTDSVHKSSAVHSSITRKQFTTPVKRYSNGKTTNPTH